MIRTLESIQKPYVIVYDKKCISGIANYPSDFKFHNQEEADILMILQVANVAELNPFSELTIVSPKHPYIYPTYMYCYPNYATE